jgi:hypothetical protein|tara:strand:+ start:5082 stop:6365 length:1284 start_codon:yes stop_codon:yes gene_type:complete
MSYNSIGTGTNKIISATSKTNLITSVDIDFSKMETASTSRSVRVVGDSNAVFSLQVSRSSNGQFYNFSTNTFSATYGSQSRLTNLSPGNTSIIFPAASGGDTYTVYVWPEPHFNTRLSFGKNKLRYVEEIEQAGTNAVVTFTTDTSIATISATSMGSSSGSSTSSYTQSNAPTVNFRDTQLTVPSSASDFGVNITGCTTDCVNGTWNTNALYWQTGNYVANGAGTSSTALILDSVDGLYIGMQVAYVNGVFQTALRAITAINTTTKTVTLDGNETWSNDHVILFRAYGIDLISSAININLTLANPTVRLGQLSTTLRTVIESGQATADVNGTKGIGAGAIARCRFINNSTSTSASKISAVTGSTTAGVITITNAEFTAGGYVGDIIYIDNFSNLIFLTGDISITRYPTADQTIYIDTSKFLTAGAAS